MFTSTARIFSGVITFEHYDDLWGKVHKGQERQAKDEFLRILPTRGRKAYLWFCHILLIKAEQEFLYDLLGKVTFTLNETICECPVLLELCNLPFILRQH